MLDAARPRPPAPPPLPPGALHRLYAWLDALPPSRRKRHLARDFSDGVMLAEVVKLFGPRLVDLHKYVPTCNTGQKRSNWSVLNRKVFHKLGLSVSGRDPKGDRQHPWGHRAHPVCSEGQGGGLEDPPGTAGHKRLGPDRAPSSSEPVPLPICDRETPAGLRTRTESASSGGLTAQRWSPLQEAGRSSGDAAGEPWQHLDPGLPQRLLEEKERVLAVLRETVKILQMKVARLEHPVKLKDQRVRALTRRGDQPQGGGTRGQKGPLPCPPDSDLEPTWKSPRLGVSGCGNALSIRRGATEEDPSQRVHKQRPGPS
ncbi:sperm flagellar protein 1-like isoform X6 [Bos javanicus]|uniref:sperm flagellar protein 1-like isoform X6 n=1 Tax=Bos javanicus TaxID=9906 RepID=UPI002AA85075|nr:sperm flagellar protein 1-like isoform X6 [Bos javanicus]